MGTIYVAGPVFRPVSKDPVLLRLYRFYEKRGIYEIYHNISRTAASLRAQILLPESERFLDLAEPRSFYEEIVHRVSSSTAVISLFTRLDTSGPVESAIAALTGKKQMIIAPKALRMPRIVRGLPGVVEFVEYGPGRDVTPRVRAFVEEFGFQ